MSLNIFYIGIFDAVYPLLCIYNNTSYIAIYHDFCHQFAITVQGECVQFFTLVTTAVMNPPEHLFVRLSAWFLRRRCQKLEPAG